MIFLDGLSGGAVSFLVDGSVPVSYLLADNLGFIYCLTLLSFLNC